MRERLEADRPITAQADTRATPSTPGKARAFAALQRLAGNAAVNRLVAQPVLVIEDQGKRLDNEAEAAKFLEAAFTEQYGEPPAGAQQTRLREMATAANDPEVVDPIPTLAAAVDYIGKGVAINAPRGSYNPERSPVRGAPSEWGYGMAGRQPSPIEAPQSPQYDFPTAAHPPAKVDVPGMLFGQQKAITKKRAEHAGEEVGKNLFRYRVEARLRVTPMELTKAAAGPDYYQSSGPSKSASAGADSDVHQSKFDQLIPGGKRERKEASMRKELQTIHDRYKDHKTLKDMSIYSRDRGDDYFEAASSNAISTMFVHSEVQAAADAHDGTAKSLVAGLIAAIELQAKAEQGVPGKPIRVVVETVTMAGFSAPNTVCGNACKGALVHIAEMLDAEFTDARAVAKAALKPSFIFLRGTAGLSFSAHIQGEKDFQGKGKGAASAPPGGVGTEAANRQVFEYEPGPTKKKK
ncbi:MAG: hypothetical protein QOF60_2658 [Actinomycetota bacterium]|nr:hypothetical protein [Actinomycetota bacterium]